MAENRKIWPLLVYGGLAAIAAARRAQTERTPAIGSREIGREPRRITYRRRTRAARAGRISSRGTGRSR